MSEELQSSLAIIKKACAAVVADLANHQAIQAALATVETALSEKTVKYPEPAYEPPKSVK